MPQPAKLILQNHQAPGDILMLTAAVRDLHRCHPGKFLTDVPDASWQRMRTIPSPPQKKARNHRPQIENALLNQPLAPR